MEINVLTNNSCPNSRAFNCFLLLAKRYFAEKKIHFNYFYRQTSKIFFCDVLFINSFVFKQYWQNKKQVIFKFLETARKYNIRIIWFDTTDSTWCTQFEVLPYVDFFLKNQIFADKKQYLKAYRTGRIFTDYFDELYQTKESSSETFVPDEEELSKVDVSWNSCFENYTASRLGVGKKLKQRLRPFVTPFVDEKLNIDFIPVKKTRNTQISCRIGVNYSRPSVVAHRDKVIELLKRMGVACEKLPLQVYFKELGDSRIGISPFGVGEITIRDFEIIICGATLVKPDLSHLKTWPDDLFIPDRTFVCHRWDLSDMEERITYLIENPEKAEEIALNAQDTYKKALSEQGLRVLTERMVGFIESKLSLNNNPHPIGFCEKRFS